MKKIFSLVLILLFCSMAFPQASTQSDSAKYAGGWKMWGPYSDYDALSSIIWYQCTMKNKTLHNPTLTGQMTLANGEIIKNAPDGDIFAIYNDGTSTLGQWFFESSIDNDSVADNDVFEIITLRSWDEDSTAKNNWGLIQTKITDATGNSKDSDLLFKTYAANSQVTPLTLSGADATFAGTVTVGSSGAGKDVTLYGGTASNSVFYDASEDLLAIAQTNANTSGTERAATVTLTQTGAGAISEAFYSKVVADVHTGSWVNGIVGRVDYSTGATGDASGGMAAAICAEMNLPARTPSGGTYTCLDLELEAPANYSAITSPTSFPVSYMRMALWGDATATDSWQDYGYIFHLADLDDATGNVFYDNTLRILANTTAWYIPLSDAEGEYSSAYQIDISNATDASSTTTGSIQTDGGLGVVKAIYGGSTISAATSFIPDAADGATLGTAALEFSDLYLADAGVAYFGADQDVTLTHVADTGLLLNAAMQMQFRDNALLVYSSADGQLDIDADTEVEIATTTLDLNAALDVSGSATFASTLIGNGHGGTFVVDTEVATASYIGVVYQSVFTFTADAITITDAAAAGAHGSKKIFDFPEGIIKVIGSVSDISVTCGTSGLTATATYDYGIGSATAGVDNSTLASTEQDIINVIEGDLSSSAADWNGYYATDLGLDGHTTASDAYINIAFEEDDASGNDVATITGVIKITWVNLGDY